MIYAVTLVYNPYEMMKASLNKFDETIGLPRDQFKHILIDQHYPNDREKIKEWIDERAKIDNVLVYDPGKNLGLARGFNYAFSKINLQPDDLVILYDPDMCPVTPGWGEAMVKVHQDKSIAWTTLIFDHVKGEMSERGFRDLEINGIRVRQTFASVVNSCCMLKASFLIESGGTHEVNPYYGGLECHMWPYLIKQDLKWVFLLDYIEDQGLNHLRDPDYTEYKYATTHGGEEQLEFNDWLIKHGRKKG